MTRRLRIEWRPGDKVILPPPQTQDAAAERVGAQGLECTDWYFCKRNL